MPEALPGFGGGRLPGRSRAEGGREEDDEEEVRKVQNEMMNVTLAEEQTVMDAAEGNVAWKAVSVAQSFTSGKEYLWQV